MFCSSCGFKAQNYHKFCIKCGHRLPQRKPPPEPAQEEITASPLEPPIAEAILEPEEMALPQVELVATPLPQETKLTTCCPNCGFENLDFHKFCTKCVQPLPKSPEPLREALGEFPLQVELPPVSQSVVGAVSPSVECIPSSAELMEAAPLAQQPRVEVLGAAPALRVLSRQVDFLLTGLGTLMVLIAFFLGWFHVSSPLANVFLGGLVAFDMSGMTILTGFSDFGLPGSPIVAVVPLLALGALSISLLRSFREGALGRKSSIVQIVAGLLGIAFILITLLGVQASYDSAFRRLGLPPMVGQKIISFDPAIGFWLTLLGFILVIGGAIWTWQTRTLK